MHAAVVPAMRAPLPTSACHRSPAATSSLPETSHLLLPAHLSCLECAPASPLVFLCLPPLLPAAASSPTPATCCCLLLWMARSRFGMWDATTSAAARTPGTQRWAGAGAGRSVSLSLRQLVHCSLPPPPPPPARAKGMLLPTVGRRPLGLPSLTAHAPPPSTHVGAPPPPAHPCRASRTCGSPTTDAALCPPATTRRSATGTQRRGRSSSEEEEEARLPYAASACLLGGLGRAGLGCEEPARAGA